MPSKVMTAKEAVAKICDGAYPSPRQRIFILLGLKLETNKGGGAGCVLKTK